MTALEKFIARRKQDGVDPDTLTGSNASIGTRRYRMRKSDGRPMFRDHLAGRPLPDIEPSVAA